MTPFRINNETSFQLALALEVFTIKHNKDRKKSGVVQYVALFLLFTVFISTSKRPSFGSTI